MNNPLLSLEKVSRRLGKIPVIENVDLVLQSGETAAILGQKDSGKSVLLKLAAGLIRPTAGEIQIEGSAPSEKTSAIVSYLPECCHLPLHMTVPMVLDFFSLMFEDFDRARAEELLGALKVSTKKTLRSLSHGTQKKIALILSMCRRAKLYLLDDPLGGIDAKTRHYLLDMILSTRAPGSAILMTLSQAADVEEHLSSCFLLADGKLLAGGAPCALLSEGETLDELYGRLCIC